MARCYQNCKHNWCNVVCRKYDESILTSRHPLHYGLLLHPLEYLSIYYDYRKKDIQHLIDIVDKFSDDDASKNIVKKYKQNGYISFKQRKLLIYRLLNCCYEGKEHGW